MADVQVREIRVIAQTSGSPELKQIADALGQVNKSASSLASGVSSLRSTFLSYYAILGVGRLTDVSDELTRLYDRFKNLTGSTQGANDSFGALQQVAANTRGSLSAIGNEFSRIAGASDQTGASTKVLTTLVTTLTNSYRLSGSSADQASEQALTLARGLATGTFQAREFRNILVQNDTLARALTKTFGVQKNELIGLAQDGYFTADKVLKAVFASSNDINNKSKELTVTFGDSLTRAVNKLSIGLFTLVNLTGANNAFSTFIDFLIDRLPSIGLVLGAIAVTQIPLLITSLQALGAAMLAFSLSNPFTAAFALASAAIIGFGVTLQDVEGVVITALDKIVIGIIKVYDAGYLLSKAIDKVAGSDLAGEVSETRNRLLDLSISLEKMKTPLDQTAKSFDATKKEIAAFLANLPKNIEGPAALKDILGELNTKLLEGKITFDQYNQKLGEFDMYKLRRQFSEGKTELEAFLKNMIKVREVINLRDFNTGAIDVEAFNKNVKALKIEELSIQFRTGKITLQEYNAELLKTRERFRGAYQDSLPFQVGIQNYINSVGTLATGIAGVVTGAFSHLETALLDFMKGGKASFADFTQAVLDDLNKIIIRATIISPLAQGLLGAIGPSTPAATKPFDESYGLRGDSFDPSYGLNSKNATGNVFDNGLKKFATGGVVSTPTLFKYGSGNNGLMGEAGPEAILPLSRGSGGKLGVQATVTPVTVNVINNAGVDVDTQESTDSSGGRTIDLIIKAKVSEGLSNGSFDKVMRNSYGLQRKGS